MLSAYLFYPSFCTIFRIPIFNLFFFLKFPNRVSTKKSPLLYLLEGQEKRYAPGQGPQSPASSPKNRNKKNYCKNRRTTMTNTNIAYTNKPVPMNHLICGKNVYYCKDAYTTWNNNNIMVVGTSGCGKTRCMVEPAIIQADCSYVISDPKGKLYRSYEPYLRSRGYKVIKMDFIHPEKSVHYNPILGCKTSQDVQKLAHALTYSLSERKGSKTVDPFWDQATLILLNAIIGYMMEEDRIADSEKTISMISGLINESAGEMKNGGRESALKSRMEEHNAWMTLFKGKPSWAYKRFLEFDMAPDRTHNTIDLTALCKLATFDTEEIRTMLSSNEVDFNSLGREKVAVFVEVSDSDRSMDVLVNLFYTQMMNSLCSYADEECADSRLPVPVSFILDDFATNARIDNFENMISNIRSRNISAMIMVQSEAQLQIGYGVAAETIVNNCSTYIYLGGTDPEMAKRMSVRVNKLASSILSMPNNMSYVCRRGQEPIYCEHFDIDWFKKEMGIEDGKPWKWASQKHLPDNAGWGGTEKDSIG